MKNDIGRRIDLHMHSIFSDGSLLPSGIAQEAVARGYEAIAITDHVDSSNLKMVVSSIVSVAKDLNKHLDLTVIPGAEITHTPVALIDEFARDARKLGAKLVVAHGETIVEPVPPKTNLKALTCGSVDILAHPGLLTEEEARLAEKNGVYLEITSRSRHCWTNGYIARLATKTGAKLLLNTDLHQLGEFLTQEQAFQIALGAGLKRENAMKVIRDNPRELVRRVTEND